MYIYVKHWWSPLRVVAAGGGESQHRAQWHTVWEWKRRHLYSRSISWSIYLSLCMPASVYIYSRHLWWWWRIATSDARGIKLGGNKWSIIYPNIDLYVYLSSGQYIYIYGTGRALCRWLLLLVKDCNIGRAWHQAWKRWRCWRRAFDLSQNRTTNGRFICREAEWLRVDPVEGSGLGPTLHNKRWIGPWKQMAVLAAGFWPVTTREDNRNRKVKKTVERKDIGL